MMYYFYVITSIFYVIIFTFYVMRVNNYVIVQYGPMNLINKQKQALFLCFFLLVSIQKQIKQEKTCKKYLTNKHNAAYD
jgi:hypothetical protein